MATTINELWDEQIKLDGTQGSELFQQINGWNITESEFNNMLDAGELPKRIAKKGFIPTHKAVWTYSRERNRFGEWALYKRNYSESAI